MVISDIVVVSYLVKAVRCKTVVSVRCEMQEMSQSYNSVTIRLNWDFSYKYKYALPNPTIKYPDSKDHGANMGPTWDLSAPGGPHVGSMNLDSIVS